MADIDLPPPDRLQAFTLTEVLVTLVVIGIVAALTIPNMMNNSNGEEFRAGFKKSVLSLKQAVRLHYIAGGLSPLKYSNNTDLINDLFKTRMNVLEVKGNPFKSGYRMTDCDFTNKAKPVCTEYTPDISNTLITQDGYIYYFVENKRADGAIPIVVDVNGQRRPNKPTINKNEPKDQYTVLLYDDIYLTQKQIRKSEAGCTEPSCYACTDPSCFCTDPSCYECTDPSCEEPTFTPDPGCTDPSCTQTPDPSCTDPSCTQNPDPDPEPEPCVNEAKPANCISGYNDPATCKYVCTQQCTNKAKPDNCAIGYNNPDCSYVCEYWNEAPENCTSGYERDDGTYYCLSYGKGNGNGAAFKDIEEEDDVCKNAYRTREYVNSDCDSVWNSDTGLNDVTCTYTENIVYCGKVVGTCTYTTFNGNEVVGSEYCTD